MTIKQKTYKARVFGRLHRGFRGVRTGFGPHHENREFVFLSYNADATRQTLKQRNGMVRRNQIPYTISHAHVLETARALSAGDKIYAQRVEDLLDTTTELLNI